MQSDETFNNEVREFFATIRMFASDKLFISVPSVLEFQYAINHLCLARQKAYEIKRLKQNHAETELNEANEARLKHLDKASGHFHRSHLDMLKCHILEAQLQLAERGLHHAVYFGYRQGCLRQKELAMLGTRDRSSIFGEYRELLGEILPFYTNPKSGLSFSGTIPRASNTQDESEYPNEINTRLYLEWADLEARLAALTGQRWYEHIMLVVRSFVEKEWDRDLPLWIATLKLSLLERLEQSYVSEAKSQGNYSPDFCMFTIMGYNEGVVAKWRICQSMISVFNPGSASGQDQEKLIIKLDMLKESINELFQAYPKLVSHFELPVEQTF